MLGLTKVSLLTLLFLGVFGIPQIHAASNAEELIEIKKLISQLGADEFESREEAMKLLKKKGSAALLSVQDAATNAMDIEIKTRASKLYLELLYATYAIELDAEEKILVNRCTLMSRRNQAASGDSNHFNWGIIKVESFHEGKFLILNIHDLFLVREFEPDPKSTTDIVTYINLKTENDLVSDQKDKDKNKNAVFEAIGFDVQYKTNQTELKFGSFRFQIENGIAIFGELKRRLGEGPLVLFVSKEGKIKKLALPVLKQKP